MLYNPDRIKPDKRPTWLIALRAHQQLQVAERANIAAQATTVVEAFKQPRVPVTQPLPVVVEHETEPMKQVWLKMKERG